MQGKHTKESGQAVIIAVVLFLLGSTLVTTALAAPVTRDLRAAHNLVESKKSFFVGDALLDDLNYRLSRLLPVAGTEVLTIDGITATGTVTTVLGGKDVEIVSTTEEKIVRSAKASLAVGAGVAFDFALQTDVGGLILENSASVGGNVYSNGTVVGSGSNIIGGGVVSADVGGLIEKVHATSSAYAHTIKNSTIDEDAYYQTISGSTVLGTSYPGSADQPTTTLPITDEQVAEWEALAEAGGTISSPCPYKIDENASLGPVKINCDLEISGNITLTLNGPVWVTGNIDFQNDNIVRVNPSLVGVSIAMIADKPSNQTTSSKINVQNAPIFQGAGDRSYILLLSQNRSAKDGGSEVAINVQNYASGQLLVYAARGEILLQNNISLREVTGYRIRLKNSAKVTYETGLVSVLFSAGPSGSYGLSGWGEI
jgi:hypothetical protein